MGFISDLIDGILGLGHTASSDPKETEITESEGVVRVHNGDVIIDHTEGTHDTIFSNTYVDTKTGDIKIDEGGHGPNYQK